MSARCVLICAALSLSFGTATAWAQGNGNAFGRAKGARPPAQASSVTGSGASGSLGVPQELHISGAGIRNFGSWLDDAGMLPVGRGFLSLGAGLWRMPGYQEVDVPTIDTAVGVHRAVQVGASVPYFYANEPGGPIARGFGTVYLSTKVRLRDAAAGGLGLSITPMLEVPPAAPVLGSRVSWAIPVNVELQRPGWRTYASTGYFSRGAIFGSAALEKSLSNRLWMTGTISQSYSTREDALSAALGLSRHRVDVGGGAGMSLSPAIAVFGSIGRTVSRQDANSSTLTLIGGMSFSFAVR